MKYFKFLSGLLALVFFTPFSAVSEDVYIDEDDIIVESPAEVAKKAVSAPSKVVILNNQQVQQKQNLSSQPPVQVKGIPIVKAKTVELRKSREEAEMATEQRIVEKLERSRLRDEQERLKKLFPSEPTKSVVAVDGSASLAGSSSVLEDDDADKFYAGFHIGQSDNFSSRVENLKSYGSYGFSFGSHDSSGLMLEAALFYTPHTILQADSYIPYGGQFYPGDYATEVDQFSGLLSLKYSPFSSRFKPYLGLMAGYTIWSYKDEYAFEYECSMIGFSYCGNNDRRTNSVDVGLNVGADLQLSPKLSVGLSIIVNIFHIYDNNNTSQAYDKYWNPYRHSRYDVYNGYQRYEHITIEETNWIIASINAKLYF